MENVLSQIDAQTNLVALPQSAAIMAYTDFIDSTLKPTIEHDDIPISHCTTK